MPVPERLINIITHSAALPGSGFLLLTRPGSIIITMLKSELFRLKGGENLARPMTLNGGAKEVFPRAVGNGLLDLRTLRAEIEEAETLAEDPRQSLAVRRHWRAYRDHLECALDARIDLLQHSVDSHERAISGRAVAMCREYERCDPSCKELDCLAAARLQMKRVRSAGTSPDAA